jgi:peptidoglycan-associated lipoprotein
MRPFTNIRQLLACGAPAFALTVLIGACGGSHPIPAQAPAASLAPVHSTPQTSASLPNTPTAANVTISSEILRACNIPDGDAYFAFDSAQLTTFDHGPLDAVATCFTRGPLANHRLSLVGHADPRGAHEYNVSLGQSRADAVGTYLADRGMRRSNEATTSRGALDAAGHDETGWAHDRRVDVMLAN